MELPFELLFVIIFFLIIVAVILVFVFNVDITKIPQYVSEIIEKIFSKK
jgi:beta-lactam-binding protein with PASTA domain